MNRNSAQPKIAGARGWGQQNRQRRTAMLLGASAAVLVSLPLPAQAQSAPTGGPVLGPAATAGTESQNTQVASLGALETFKNPETVVVTARRRAETVQDVPAAITVIGGDKLSDLLVNNTASLIRQVPGATLVNAGPSYLNDISLRGQGGGRVGFSETTTGLYRDGHYVAGGGFGGSSLNRLDLFDLQRMEVMRGPQGALYGRNAVGGSVNAIARKPELDTFGGWAKASYANYDSTTLGGAINIPVVEGSLAMRVAGFWDHQASGFITNVNTGDKVDQNGFAGGRAAILWQIASNVDTTLTFEYYHSRTPAFGNLGYKATLYNGQPLDPGVFDHVLSTEAYTHINQRSVYLDTHIGTSYGDWHVKLAYMNRHAGRLDEDLSHFLGFEDVSFGPILTSLFADQTEAFAQTDDQIYLVSPQSLKRWTWLVGAEYLNNRDKVFTDNRGTAAPPGLRAVLRDDNSLDKLTSWAVYGTLGYDITPKLNVDVELRLQQDNKNFNFARTPNSPASLTVPISAVLSRSWTRVLPVATLRYKFNEAQTVYARFATGYRPGDFNTGIPADIPGSGDLIPYNPEDTTGGELGYKGAFFDGRWTFNLATYYTETDNVQVVTQASPTVTSFILQNAGNDHIYGVELETDGNIDVGFGMLNVNASISSNNGSFDKGTKVLYNGVVTDLSGLRVDRTRDYEAVLGAILNVPVWNDWMGSLGANMQAEGGGWEDAVHARKLSDFALFDFTASLTNGRWGIAAWVKNAGDRTYRLQTVSNNEYFNTRREYGIDFSYRF